MSGASSKSIFVCQEESSSPSSLSLKIVDSSTGFVEEERSGMAVLLTRSADSDGVLGGSCRSVAENASERVALDESSNTPSRAAEHIILPCLVLGGSQGLISHKLRVAGGPPSNGPIKFKLE